MFEISYRIVVSRPHLAGTPGDKWLATYIKEQWEEHGLDDVATVPYDVLLSYTNPDEPNKVKNRSNTFADLWFFDV